LYVLGGSAALVGSLGLGAWLGRQQADETLRIKVAPAFRRTARLYRRLGVLQADLESATDDVRSHVTKDSVPVAVVMNALNVVATRLESEASTYDNALDEWHELAPDEVDKEREGLNRDGGFGG